MLKQDSGGPTLTAHADHREVKGIGRDRKMKPFYLFLLSINIALFSSLDGHAAETIPVCYWQLLAQERYIYRRDMDHLNWREIRQQRELDRTARQAPKRFRLKLLEPDNTIGTAGSLAPDWMHSVVAVMRDPNGEIHEISNLPEAQDLFQIPQDLDLIGRYLIGARIVLGKRDVDGDGVLESIHLCAKRLISHRKSGGKMGRVSVVFLDDAEHVPLEIGPVINTVKFKYGGDTQRPHRSYEMMVKYLNRPLPGARVRVVAQGSQWEKTYVTDDAGRFEIMPMDDRWSARKWQQYMYVVTHHDREKNGYYVSTFPVMVYKNRPEWLSKAMGFTYWTICGSALILLLVIGLVRRRHWQDNRLLITFENRKIKAGPP